MNDIDEMQEDMLRVVRDSLSKMPMSDPPCVEAIVAPARDRRRRRHALISAAGAAVAAVLVLVTVGALSVRNDTPRSATDTATTRSTSDSPRSTLAPVRLTAVSFVANSDGTATLTLSNDQLFSDRPRCATTSRNTTSRRWSQPAPSARRRRQNTSQTSCPGPRVLPAQAWSRNWT